MNKKHILVISQYFYPESFRINDICKEWVKRGYKVTVVTGIPNYPEGKFYKGYGWTKKRKETWEGIDIIRLPIFARRKGKIRLVLNYFSFIMSGFFWRLFTRVKADFVFTFGVSPVIQARVGIGYSKQRKVPHCIYVQDLWPETIEVVSGISNRVIIKSIEKSIRKIYKRSKLILATSEGFVSKIQERVFDNKDKVKCWYQYAEDFYVPTKKLQEELVNDNSFKIIFTGNIGYSQGLGILPKVALILKEKGTQVKFVIVGNGRYKSNLVSEIKQLGVEDMFKIVSRKPAEEIPSYLCSCQAAFVSFSENSLFEYVIPAKLQSYMSCAMPIIASAKGETKRVVEQANCGVCAEIGNAKSLAQTIEQFMLREDIKELGQNAYKYSLQHFNKKLLMDEMDGFINQCK